MENKKVLIIVAVFIMLFFMMVYWFVPVNWFDFKNSSKNYNFTLNSSGKINSFYENLRFPTTNISYNVNANCNINKNYDMNRAFEIISNNTILDFYPVTVDESIAIACEDKIIKDESGLFVAGEGGPTKIVVAGNYNVIKKGEILLIKNSDCPNPNIAIHELLHVLGFNHSENSDNIMYPVTKCEQQVSQDIYDKINNLYSEKPYVDLIIENVSATMNGKYLDANISIKNIGIIDSDAFKIKIYSDGSLVKEIDSNPMEIGHGILLRMNNMWVSKLDIDEIEFVIETSQPESNKENNKVKIKL